MTAQAHHTEPTQKSLIAVPPVRLVVDKVLSPFDRLAGMLLYGWRKLILRTRRYNWQAMQWAWRHSSWLRHWHVPLRAGAGAGDIDPMRQDNRRMDEHNGKIALSMAIIGLSARLIRSDGRETPEEYQAFCHEFPMPETESSKVRRLYNEAAEGNSSPAFYGRCIASLYPDDQELGKHILRRLFAIAAVDRPINLTELRFLREAAEAMRLPNIVLQHLCRDFMGCKGQSPYEVIGVRKHVSADGLKEAYRRQLRACHPDKMLQQEGPLKDGVEQEWVSLMSHRAASLTAAYDQIVRMRGLRKAA